MVVAHDDCMWIRYRLRGKACRDGAISRGAAAVLRTLKCGAAMLHRALECWAAVLLFRTLECKGGSFRGNVL